MEPLWGLSKLLQATGSEEGLEPRKESMKACYDHYTVQGDIGAMNMLQSELVICHWTLTVNK